MIESIIFVDYDIGLQVMEVQPTQEVEDCKRLLIFAIDALITRLRAVGVRKHPSGSLLTEAVKAAASARMLFVPCLPRSKSWSEAGCTHR